MLAVALAPGAAIAQDLVPDSASEAYALASPADAPDPVSDNPLSPEDSAGRGQALVFDPADLSRAAPVKKLRLPSLSNAKGLAVSRTANPDGSSLVAVKQPLPAEWDATVGADLGLAAPPPIGYRPGVPLLKPRTDPGSGAAWASVGLLPNLATLDARVDPANDRGKLGTTFKHSMPIGSNFAVTLQSSYSVTETLGAPAAVAAAQTTPQVWGQIWGNEKAAKFDILSTGTSFGAKLASSSDDPVTHNMLSADQKLYGPLHVTTAVTDAGQPTSSKSITAGFKLNW